MVLVLLFLQLANTSERTSSHGIFLEGHLCIYGPQGYKSIRFFLTVYPPNVLVPSLHNIV